MSPREASNVNPFRLAELIARRPINWNKYADETQAMCEILNISKQELFARNCPVLTPYTKTMADGSVKVLSEQEAQARLESYLAARTKRRITKTPPMRRLALKTVRSRLPELLFPDSAQGRTGAKPVETDWSMEGCSWRDMGEYFKETPEFDDPIQGNVGDCYLIAAMSGVAWTRPYAITNRAAHSSFGDDESPKHKFTFYNPGGDKTGTTVEVSEKVLVNTTGSTPQWIYACSRDTNETWPAVLEKAYAKWRSGASGDCPNMETLKSGVAAAAAIALIGGSGYWTEHNDTTAEKLWTHILSNCLGSRTVNPMFALTPDLEEGDPRLSEYAVANIITCHFYTILGWESRDGKNYVVLRNPWGYAVPTIDVLSGSWKFQDFDGKWYSIPFDRPDQHNGIFALEINTFYRYFLETSLVKNDLIGQPS